MAKIRSSSSRTSPSPTSPFASGAASTTSWPRLAELRRQGVRTTKAELTEMLLWELAGSDLEDLQQRLAAFRRHAPR